MSNEELVILRVNAINRAFGKEILAVQCKKTYWSISVKGKVHLQGWSCGVLGFLDGFETAMEEILK